MQRFIPVSFIVAALLLPALTTASESAQTRPIAVTFSELISHPQQYNGKRISVSGISISGFEISALGESTIERNGIISLKEPLIWLGAAVARKHECFSQKDLTFSYTFCQADVEGIFEYGLRYGHLGQYQFTIRSENDRLGRKRITPSQHLNR